MKHGLLLLLIPALIACSGVRTDLIRAEIVRAEDTRNVDILRYAAGRLRPDETALAARAAIASGRIPDFVTWRNLAGRFGNDNTVADALAIAVRFPGTDFPVDDVRNILAAMTPGPENTVSLLYLNDADALETALRRTDFADKVAGNLWRAPAHVTAELAAEWYASDPVNTLYSLYRLQLKDIVQAADLAAMPLEQRVYGCAICSEPDLLLKDEDWRVRIAALKAVPTRLNAQELLEDPNVLVRAEALRVFGREDGGLWRLNLEELSPMQAEWLFRERPGEPQIMQLFEKGGMMAHALAPYLPDGQLEILESAGIAPTRILMYLERTQGEDATLAYARERFTQVKDSAALQYLLDKLPDEEKDAVAKQARETGGELLSILDDFGYLNPDLPERSLAVTLADLKEADALTGFTLVTEKGSIHCEFYPEDAPLTCLNLARLARKGYFNNVFIHRVAPAFVTQDGDPSGTSSGGPGWTIRCEYNARTYDRAGVVGMALAGKDTGGSQYFLTHLATPHLDHKYTIFAAATDGVEVLSELEQYDRITGIQLDETAEPTGH